MSFYFKILFLHLLHFNKIIIPKPKTLLPDIFNAQFLFIVIFLH